ncbi:hypothetical protein ABZU76_48695 [Amycolatopsis sp. NPDC005232]|uniref:hypothetical protein n=1 Tax=Amycolatopsis sp. NPDC005232 TaxID=3157027 RepID=UPI0033BA6F70
MNHHRAARPPCDVESGLRALIARGYQFVHPSDATGAVLAVVGVRVHGDVVDVVRLDAEDDATATRMPADEENVFTPSTWLWRTSGPATRVLADLLALPDETTPAAARGCWVPGRPGTAKWLAAS